MEETQVRDAAEKIWSEGLVACEAKYTEKGTFDSGSNVYSSNSSAHEAKATGRKW